MTYTNYDIDGWYVSLPQNWQMSLDKEQQPPQIIFEVPEEPVTIYISTWDFQRPETGELAGRKIWLLLFCARLKCGILPG